MQDVALLSSVNESDELPDGLRHSIAQMHERWNNRLRLKKLNIAKDYIEGRLGVVVELDSQIGAKSGYPRSAIWPQVHGAIFHLYDYPPVWAHNFQPLYMTDGNDRDNELMLPDDIEAMHTIECFPFPSFI